MNPIFNEAGERLQPVIWVTPIRRALARSTFGNSGKYIYIEAESRSWYRIVDVRMRRGVLEGRLLDSGRWTRIFDWEER
jgi:hypothetical protein